MIVFDESENAWERLWHMYADIEYSVSGHQGFREYVAHLVPEGRVSGTTLNGLSVEFDREEDAVLFALKWL